MGRVVCSRVKDRKEATLRASSEAFFFTPKDRSGSEVLQSLTLIFLLFGEKQGHSQNINTTKYKRKTTVRL